AFVFTFFYEGFNAEGNIAIASVVILALAFSLIESKWILPAHLMGLARPEHEHKKRGFLIRIQDFVDGILGKCVRRIYRPLLERALSYRYATLALFVVIFFVSIAAITGGLVRFELNSEIQGDGIAAVIGMENDVGSKALQDTVKFYEDMLLELDEEIVKNGGASVVENFKTGFTGRASARIRVELTSAEMRDLAEDEILQRWVDKVGRVPGVKNSQISIGRTSGSPPISFNLLSDDLEDLERAGDEMVNKLASYSGVYGINNPLIEGAREAVINIKPEAEAKGLSLASLAEQMRWAFYGITAQRIQRGDDEIKVMVRYEAEARRDYEDLESMYVQTAQGALLPFSSVAAVDFQTGFTTIERSNGKRRVEISAFANTDIAEPGKISRELQRYFNEEVAPRYPGMSFAFSGFAQQEAESIDSLLMGLLISLLLIYGLMAIPLKSYFQPLMIMSVIPFGFIGVVFGHWLLGLPMSILSFVGMIALAGVVVNDSLVMVDFVNRNVRSGVPIETAARDSGVRRFRAILLTSLTTFFGLAPIMTETSFQAQFVIPMAVSLGFGILFSTLVTLILVPTLYVILQDFKGFGKSRKGLELEMG
ncbi:MAG: efflux RND transporter permease subunit, partial [Verrucomicrobiota bacterium]